MTSHIRDLGRHPAATLYAALDLLDGDAATQAAAVERLRSDPVLAWTAPLLVELLDSIERDPRRELIGDLRESLGLPRRRLSVV